MYIPVYTLPMNAVNSKTFKSGNSVAVRLPREVAFAPDTKVIIERNGDVLTIRPAIDPVSERARLQALLDDLAAIGSPGDGIQQRDPFDFPDRRGL